MKKLLFFVAIAVTAICVNAQFRINKNGQISIGENKNSEDLWGGANIDTSFLDLEQPVLPGDGKFNGGGSIVPMASFDTAMVQNPVIKFPYRDDLTSLFIFGDEEYKGARISFGDCRGYNIPNVMVGELGTDDTDKLLLYGYEGAYLVSRRRVGNRESTDTVAFYDKSKGDYVQFNCDVKAPAVLLPSDSRLKTDVKDLDNKYLGLDQLNAVSFRMRQDSGSDASNSLDNQLPVHYGFIAEDVKNVYPELVYTDFEGYMYVDYLGMIPLLVDAVNNLQAKSDSLESVINELKSVDNSPRKVQQNGGLEGTDMLQQDGIVLYQNTPNPFSAATEICCKLPYDVKQADLYVYDLQGAQKKRVEVQGRGDTSVTIRGTELQPGMYIYSLIVDGVEADSKRMILTD